MTDLSEAPSIEELESRFDRMSYQVDRAHHMLSVLDLVFGNELLVALSLTTDDQRNAAEQVFSAIEATQAFVEDARTNLNNNYHAYHQLFKGPPIPIARHASIVRAADHPQVAAWRRKWSAALQVHRATSTAVDAAEEDEEIDKAVDTQLNALWTLIGTQAPDLEAVKIKIELAKQSGQLVDAADDITCDLDTLMGLMSRGHAIRSEAAVAWDGTMARYLAAKADEEAYDAKVWHPAYKANEADPSTAIPDDVNTEMERLQGIRYDLRNDLMKLPAPGAEALHWKLAIVLEDDGGSIQCWSMSFLEQTIADYRRILGGER